MISSNLDLEKATIPEETYTVAVDCIVGMDDLDKRSCKDPRMRNSRSRFVSFTLMIIWVHNDELHFG
jgi:hypothetical protein